MNKIKNWWNKFLIQKKREWNCDHKNRIFYWYDNGLCREQYDWCSDCEGGIKPSGTEVWSGEWHNIKG